MALLADFKSYLRSCSGNVALIFSLCSSFLLAVGGSAMDYATILDARTQAQSSLDFAALATMQAISNGEIKPEKGLVKSAVLKVFEANGGAGGLASNYVINDVSVDASNTTLDAHASISVPMNFMRLVGIKKNDSVIHSQATMGIDEADIDIFFDRSLTMSLPSDPKIPVPVTKVFYPEYKKTVNCAFACHDDGNVARGKGIEIKIDTVASQIRAFMDKLESAEWKGKLLLHSFYGPVALEVGPTGDPEEVKAYFDNPVLLKGSDDAGHSTELDFALKAAYDSATGRMSKNKILLLITDGQHMRSETAYSGAYCAKIKALGVKIYVIHLTFDPASLAVKGLQDPDGTKIPTSDIIKRNTDGGRVIDYSGYDMGYFSGTKYNVANMQNCSSGTGFYFSGTSGPEIQAAFTAMSSSLSGSSLRLAR